MSHHSYGRRKEFQVGEYLERRGFSWDRSPASRGAVELWAKKGNAKWGIQVKATRKDAIHYTRLKADDERRLIELARRVKLRPVLALVTRNYVWFVSVPEDRVLMEGKLRTLKHVYIDT